MLRHAEFTMCFALILFLAGACASLPAQSTKSETLEPSGVREDCMELFPGDALNYNFKASAPLDFNIHYHESGKVYYAVSKDAVSTAKEAFLCEKQQYYCLMWTNKGAVPANLSYEWSVANKQK